jgi:hypothetical protein
MRRPLGFATALVAICVLGGLAFGLKPTPATAQSLRGVRGRNEDYGRMFRHPDAYRDELGARRGFRTDSDGSGYTYKFYDHPKPSFQFFQQGQNYRWSWDLFPGAERRIYGNSWGRGYGIPVYNSYTYNSYHTYNTYNILLLPTGYFGW